MKVTTSPERDSRTDDGILRSTSDGPPAVEVQGLRKTYGPLVAVDDVSFVVEAGEIFGILGGNGAGKTTSIECVQGLRRPDAGLIRVFGHHNGDRRHLAGLVGSQLQSSALPERLRVAASPGPVCLDGVSARAGRSPRRSGP